MKETENSLFKSGCIFFYYYFILFKAISFFICKKCCALGSTWSLQFIRLILLFLEPYSRDPLFSFHHFLHIFRFYLLQTPDPTHKRIEHEVMSWIRCVACGWAVCAQDWSWKRLKIPALEGITWKITYALLLVIRQNFRLDYVLGLHIIQLGTLQVMD